MEFYKKLQELRKQKGLTQEELAEKLYVTRTAVSKWESGRGYPNIDSLKGIAKFFSISLDDLLSGDELLTIAEADNQQKEHQTRDLIYGLLDCSAVMLLFLPFFGQKTGALVQEVSLLDLSNVESYLKIGYFIVVFGMLLWGALTLVLRSYQLTLWSRIKRNISLLINTVGALLFVISLQPYPAVLLFVFLTIKIIMVTKVHR